jgi:type IV secretion system protein VirD4
MKKLKRRADTFNPLDFIDKHSPQALDECRDLAEALVIRTGEEKDPHWNDSAEAVIAAVIAVVVMYGQQAKGTRSLQDARDILAHPQKLEIARRLMLAHGGMLARWGGQLEHLKGDELASVMSTCNRHLRFLDTLAIAASTGSSSFDPAGLRKGKMTVYLVLPPEHMRAQSALLRVWIGSLFRACLRGGLRETNQVHFVLDEAAALGHMPALDDAVDKYRGYGVRLQFYLQSLGQLKLCFPSDQGQTLLSNTTKVFFGTNDIQTAEFVSKSVGNETIVVDSGGHNSGWSKNRGSSSGSSHSESSGSSYSGGSSRNWQQQSRELLKPDEIIALDPRIAITLTPGVRPVWTRLVRYYEEKALFRHRGWLTRVAAAGWTLLVSAALLVTAIAAAAALTSELSDVLGQQQKQQVAPAGHQPQPWPSPR